MRQVATLTTYVSHETWHQVILDEDDDSDDESDDGGVAAAAGQGAQTELEKQLEAQTVRWSKEFAPGL
jgi:hypothetical protein